MKNLVNKYDTDKDENYLGVYDNLFSSMKNDPINILEIGVLNGGSLYLWKDYFTQAKIAGIDINYVEIMDDSKRISFYQGSQEDISFLRYIAEKETGAKGFDIIIDDASHMYHLTKTCFSYLFNNHLKSGGIYVIEDWGTGYWQDWPDGHMYIGENHNFGLVKFIKELVDEVGIGDITKDLNNNLPYRESKIKSMTIYHGQVVVIKH